MKVKGLQWELTVRFLVILTLLLTVTVSIGYFSMRHYLYDGKRMVLESRFHDFLEQHIKSIHTEEALIAQASALLQELPKSDMSAAIFDKSGKLLAEKVGSNQDLPPEFASEQASSLPSLSPQEYPKLLTQNIRPKDYQLIDNENGEQYVVAFYKIGSPDSPIGILQLSTRSDMVQGILRNQLLLYGIPALFMLLIGILMVRRTLRQSLKPLHKVTDTIEKITAERLHIRLSTSNRQLEVDRLSTAFNTMIEQIENSFEKEKEVSEQMRQFISDASHELRTPLTSISGFAEILLMGAAKDEQQLQLALTSIQNESERLTKLVQNLLLLTKLEQQQILKQPLSLHEVLQAMLPQLQVLAGARKVELVLQTEAYILGQADQLKQVVLNLFQNAVQHTDAEKGVITLQLSSQLEQEEVTLTVRDNGKGIPAEDVPRVFDRFFRSGWHRSRQEGGYGLGLAIVKSIVDAHNGKIHVESRLQEGTEVSISFQEASR